MPSEVYARLREQLDQYSVGYPATESGVELKILERLFTEEEAELFLNLSMMLETPKSLAERIGRDEDEVARLLERMTDKGVVFRVRRGEEARYAAVPYIVGFFEFQLPTLDRELAEMMETFFEEGYSRQASREPALMRTVPVNRAIDVSYQVARHDDAREIIKSKKKIVVADCICRAWQDKLESACDRPLETCFMFGSHADFYLEKGMGREVSQEEALRILDKCEEAGLVIQPFNAVNPGGMCNCCGDCCGILRTLKKHPRPSEVLVSSYIASVDHDECIGCGICVTRCQMEAVELNDDGLAEVDLDRCIGCGLCVTTCSSEAMRLVAKPEDKRPDLPENGQETYMRLAQRRGKSLVPLAITRK